MSGIKQIAWTVSSATFSGKEGSALLGDWRFSKLWSFTQFLSPVSSCLGRMSGYIVRRQASYDVSAGRADRSFRSGQLCEVPVAGHGRDVGAFGRRTSAGQPLSLSQSRPRSQGEQRRHVCRAERLSRRNRRDGRSGQPVSSRYRRHLNDRHRLDREACEE